MPPRTRTRARSAGPAVAVVVVAHDGARWLDACLDALAGQTVAPIRIVAVDTGSTDGSADLLTAALGADAVRTAPRDTGFADAVHLGVATLAEDEDGSVDWLWILHDDAVAAPDALARMLERVDGAPSIGVVGPKVLSYDGRYLAEIGLTLDATGRRETGLSRRELDQGQHDDVDTTLAVGSAGMLVRREVWDSLGGFERRFALYGEDLDLGWRAHLAGYRVVVAPDAVIRHAEAARRGHRRPDVISGSVRATERRRGMEVILANTGPLLVAPYVVRFVLGGLFRALAALVVRDRHVAADEMRAVGRLLRHLDGIRDLRRRRKPQRTLHHRDVRHLLAGPAARWRHRGDLLAPAHGADERPLDEEPGALPDGEPDDRSLLVRALTAGGVGAVLLAALVGVIADRHLLGGSLSGGRLAAVPAGASDLWVSYRAAWHPVGVGSTVPASPALAVMAAVSTICLGKVWFAVTTVLLAAMPLATLAAYRAARLLTPSAALRSLVALVWGLVPVVTGAVSTGRVDACAFVIVLPLAASAVARALAPTAGRRTVAWAALAFAVAAGLEPLAWLAAVPLLPIVVRTRPAPVRRGLVLLAVPLLIWLPTTIAAFTRPRVLLDGLAGPDPSPLPTPPGAALLLVHPGPAAPGAIWLLAPLIVVGLVAIAAARAEVARPAAALMIVGAAAAVALTRPSGVLAGAAGSRWWPGAMVALVAFGALIAVTGAADRARRELPAREFAGPHLLTAVAAAAVVVGVVVAGAAVALRGVDRPLASGGGATLPLFVSTALTDSTPSRALVLTDDGRVVTWSLLRAGRAQFVDGGLDPALGDRMGRRGQLDITQVVTDLVDGSQNTLSALQNAGIFAVVARHPDDAALAPLLVVLPGVVSVPTTGATVWRIPGGVGEAVVQAGATSTALATSPGGAAVTVAAGPAGRQLVLAEPSDGHWAATIGGRALPAGTAPTAAATAWVLPAAGGKVEVHRTGGHRSLLLWLDLLAALATALAVVVPALRRRRHDDEPA